MPKLRTYNTQPLRLIPKRMSAAHAQHVGLLLTLLQHESTTRCGIKAKRLKAGWDHRYLLQVLAS